MGDGGGGEAAGVELALEGSAVGLGGAASEVLDVVGEHGFMLSQVSGFPRTDFDDRLGTEDAPSSGGDAKRSGCGYISLLRETFAAEDRAALGGAKGDGSLLATLRAGGSSFDTGVMAPAADRLRRSQNGDTFGFTNLTALRFVLELFVVKKQLFPGGEDKVSTTVDASQYLILKFH